MADNSVEIAQIRATLNRGISRSSADGASATADLKALAARLRELEQTDDATLASGRPRPAIGRIRLSRFHG